MEERKGIKLVMDVITDYESGKIIGEEAYDELKDIFDKLQA